MLLEVRIQPPIVHALQRHQYYLQYFGVVYLVEVHVDAPLRHQQLLALRKTQLIALLELAVILIMLLHCVVCQVDKGLVNVLLVERKCVAARPDVALAEQVTLLILEVAAVDKDPEADVEFSTVDQQRSLDVLLDNEHLRFDVGAEVWPIGSSAWLDLRGRLLTLL